MWRALTPHLLGYYGFNDQIQPSPWMSRVMPIQTRQKVATVVKSLCPQGLGFGINALEYCILLFYIPEQHPEVETETSKGDIYT